VKIGIFLTFDYSLQAWNSGGVLNRELRIYEELAKTFGLEFTFFTYGDSDEFDLDISKKFKIVPIYSLTKKYSNKYLQIISSLIIPLRIKKEIKELDILHQHQLHGVWIPIICKFLYKKKLLIRTGYDMHYFSIKDNKSLAVKTFYKFLTYISLRYSDIYTVTSKEDQKRLIKQYKKIIKIIRIRPNWVKRVDQKAVDDRSKTNILSVGRLEYQKNYKQLLKEFENTKDTYKITIIGTGSQKNFLLNSAKNMNIDLDIVQNMGNENLVQMYKHFKYYISFSLFEGNPKTVLEAMAAGCIPICSNIPSHSEIVEDNFNGILFDLNNPNILKKLDFLNGDEVSTEKLKINALKKVREDNSIQLLSVNMYSDYKLITS
jgi:glycosyltransferase involved in cell wall biosynthesis